jgi:pyruvate dehydrogenase E2 component (dihydrolipoamide acetyltransferase)
LLQSYARAETEADFRRILPQFFGFNAEIGDNLYENEVAAREKTGATAALCKIADLLFDGKAQGVIPLEPLVAIDAPIKVAWGMQDNILPTRQARDLPGQIATHLFADTGHMLAEEQGDAVFRMVMENVRQERS